MFIIWNRDWLSRFGGLLRLIRKDSFPEVEPGPSWWWFEPRLSVLCRVRGIGDDDDDDDDDNDDAKWGG